MGDGGVKSVRGVSRCAHSMNMCEDEQEAERKVESVGGEDVSSVWRTPLGSLTPAKGSLQQTYKACAESESQRVLETQWHIDDVATLDTFQASSLA